ncbi:2-aminoethylphosphonate ABC transporter substrate-binding protein [Actinoplanes sp. NPDC024001]|uniref:2-aminoethylphosphonate ABC transporter substrate-binding protein n=1 Tax=Actinoplanes sp. NPDC024001 TaxID=3154598 RepID=UPI0033F66CFE
MLMRPVRMFLTAALAAASLTLAACGSGTATADSGDAAKTVTVYTADGLGDWYGKQFAEFQKQTGIAVQMIEAGSGEVVSRLQKERTNVQADLVVTLPPYIQQADADGLLQPYTPAGADKVTGGSANYVPVVNNYLCFIYNPAHLPAAPKTFDDLLDAKLAKKLQYSTPGQAGDGTAVLLHLQHILGKEKALEYLKKLEANNVGPSSSTGKLQPKVSKGEIWVANGDVQMNLASINNDRSNFKIFFPAGPDGKPSTFALPYVMGVAAGAPHADAAKKLADFLLSPAAQQQVSAQAYGIPARSDVKPTDAQYRQVEQALTGVEIWQPDWTTILAENKADIAAYNKALGLS